MPQWQSPVFCCFCVSEKLHRKYSQNWMKQKLNLLLFYESSKSLKRRQRGATGWPHHRGARPSPWPRPPMVRPPWSTSDAAPSPIKTPRREKPEWPNQFSRNTSWSAAVVDPRSGGSISSSRHPTGEGNRHRRSSSSPWLPPARWVSSLLWGPPGSRLDKFRPSSDISLTESSRAL
jgi:hypothetical protein